MEVLAGVRVVEMGLWVAGPAAGGILADWGAEVVKIEPPAGDPMRGLFGALSGSREQRCPPFDLYNRGKRSVALDVNTPQGRDLAERIIGDADVFLTNMRPAFLERVGLDHARLLEAYPRLIYASLTGYGLQGPDRDAPGFDVAAFSARGGVSDRSTPPGQAPVTLPGGLGDAVTGLSLVAGVLAALLHRERSGRGQLVAASLMRSGAYCIGMELSTRLGLGRLAATRHRTHPQNPLLNSYQAKDGRWFWLIGAEADRHWPAVVAATGDKLLADERFATARGRRRAGEELMALLDAAFARRSRDEWAERFDSCGVWWTPVNTVEELLCDPQAVAAGLFVEVPTTREGTDTERSLATPADFGSDTGNLLSGVPSIGADTEEVLRGLGLDAQELARLVKDGIVGGPGGPGPDD
jgi:crotonobetainyl-CoA:carnitine CoA-transferase CaiB-like acyl-CoA transferase